MRITNYIGIIFGDKWILSNRPDIVIANKTINDAFFMDIIDTSKLHYQKKFGGI